MKKLQLSTILIAAVVFFFTTLTVNAQSESIEIDSISYTMSDITESVVLQALSTNDDDIVSLQTKIEIAKELLIKMQKHEDGLIERNSQLENEINSILIPMLGNMLSADNTKIETTANSKTRS